MSMVRVDPVAPVEVVRKPLKGKIEDRDHLRHWGPWCHRGQRVVDQIGAEAPGKPRQPDRRPPGVGE